jgi:hypothetical protein
MAVVGPAKVSRLTQPLPTLAALEARLGEKLGFEAVRR